MSEYPFEMKVRRYADFADISKGKSAQIGKETIRFSQKHLEKCGYFTKIFCHHQQYYGASAPINLNLFDLKEALSNVEISEDGSLDTSKLFKNYWFEANSNAKRYGSSCRSVLREYMPLLLMPENPNKFLKMALDCRKKGSFGESDNVGPYFKDPLSDFCIGLDRIAQFLNFCVMLKQIPTKKGETVKELDQIEKLEFDRDVLLELTRQYNEEKKEVEKDIGTDNLDEYIENLEKLRAYYNNYCRATISQTSGSYDQCVPFSEWISQENKFVNKYFRACDDGPRIGIYKKTETIITDENFKEEDIDEGYHAGGGITNPQEKAKLLRLDAVLQCEKAIDQFINSKALEESTLNWFEQKWNSTWIARKLGWFFKERNVKLQLKSNQFIPKLDKFEDKKTKSSEEII